jgi:two-component system, chemotaxis family, CheB/CheR fusion protein
MQLEREHIYLIPPGAYLSIQGSALRFFATTRASRCAPAVRVLPTLVGGRAGPPRDLRRSLGNRRRRQPGLKAVKEQGGLLIAQDPDEAEYKQASGRPS